MKPLTASVAHSNVCGGCGVVFAGKTAKQAAILLQEHVYDAPCEHYANPTALQIRMREPLRKGNDAPHVAETGNVTTTTRIEGARTHAEFRLRAWEEMKSQGKGCHTPRRSERHGRY